MTRQEKDGIRRYLHLSTGNYNTFTARMYEDLGLFTCDAILGEDAVNLFGYLTGEVRVQSIISCLSLQLNCASS